LVFLVIPGRLGEDSFISFLGNRSTSPNPKDALMKRPPIIRGRGALTLVEILVVIGIIAVLMAVVVPAIRAILSWRVGPRPRLETAMEITQLDAGLKMFFLKYGSYPPSQVKLCEKMSEYGSTPLDTQSIDVLKTMFPNAWKKGSIDWDGNGAYSPPVILTGDQCLVFFLRRNGGTPAFFNFNAARLVDVRGNGFPSYLDPFRTGRPYAYFSSWPAYNTTSSDCPDLGGVDVWPYASAANIWLNPNTYQIISAGPDGIFGPGTPGGTSDYLKQSAGSSLPLEAQDDMANFSGGRLRDY
jgi:hypothetical protein